MRNIILISTIFSLLSCGSAGTNNDQGIIFQSIGYFTSSAGDSGDSGEIVALSSTTNDFGGFGAFNGRTLTTFIGLRSNLSSQFINLVRIDCDYTIQGASVNIPSDSVSSGGVISSGSDFYTEFEMITPDIFSFLNVNRNSLPELPFRMTAFCAGVGISEAGDTFVTNRSPFFIQFVESAAVTTNPGSGGAINSFGDNDSESTAVDSGGA